MRPSTADLLAARGEQKTGSPEYSKYHDSRLSPLYRSAPLSIGGGSSYSSSTPSLGGHSPSSHADLMSPQTPATPWTGGKSSTSELTANDGTGLGLVGLNSPAASGGTKLTGRSGVSRSRVEDTLDAELADELEDELNDFGYGPKGTSKTREKKESLIDMLNSEPPSWMLETEPVAVSIPRKGSLPSKIRRKFSSSAIDSELQSNFTTLQRGGSKNRKDDASLLRSSRSAGNLLTSFRSRANNFGFRMSGNTPGFNHGGQNNLQGSIDFTGKSSDTKTNSKMLDDDEFERLIHVPSPTKRLTAKNSVSASPASRDLPGYLTSSGLSPERTKSSTSLATTEISSQDTRSSNARSFSSSDDNRPGAGGGGGGGSENPSIVRAAMFKLGAAGRRASLGTSTTRQPLANDRPSTSSGIPRMSPNRTKFKRPSTAQTVASQESLYDPLNKETIQVDDSLMRGMFGGGRGASNLGDRQQEEEEKERLRDSKLGGTSALGVYEFVAIDERESGGKSPEPHRLGSLTKSLTLATMSNLRPGSASGSPTTLLASKIPSARRKPTPTVEDADLSQPLPKPHRTDSKSKVQATSVEGSQPPKVVGHSPNRGSHAAPSARQIPLVPSSAPFSSLVPTPGVEAPISPFEHYSTQPVTPTTAKSFATLENNESRSVAQTPSAGTALRSAPLKLERTSSTQLAGRSPHKEAPRTRSRLRHASDSQTNRPLSPVSPNKEDVVSSTDRSIKIDETILTALDTLRACMVETAGLPVNSDSLDEMVPTLRGLQQSMDYGSRLLSAILTRMSEQRAMENVQSDETEADERRIVEALLGTRESGSISH